MNIKKFGSWDGVVELYVKNIENFTEFEVFCQLVKNYLIAGKHTLFVENIEFQVTGEHPILATEIGTDYRDGVFACYCHGEGYEEVYWEYSEYDFDSLIKFLWSAVEPDIDSATLDLVYIN